MKCRQQQRERRLPNDARDSTMQQAVIKLQTEQKHDQSNPGGNLPFAYLKQSPGSWCITGFSWKLWCFHKAKINIDKDMYIHISQLINLYEGCMEWWRHGANLCTHQNCASFQTLVMSQFIIDESGGWGGWTKGSGHHQMLLQRDIDPCPPNYLRLRVRTSKTAQTHTREWCVFGLLREWHAGGAQ